MRIISSTPEISFNDVLLLPRRSSFLPTEEKKKISLKTKVSQHLEIDLPIASAPIPSVTGEKMAIMIGQLGGIGFLTFLQSFDAQVDQLKRIKAAKVKVIVSVDILNYYHFGKERFLKHIGSLSKLGVDMICLEAEHMGNDQMIGIVKKIKKTYPKTEICASLVATGVETTALIKAGANSIRVGIGAGSHCTTRRMTGIGRPQLSAIHDCYNAAKKYGVPIISDCGVKQIGDVAKGLVFGADVMVLGGMLAGTFECPGDIVVKDGKEYKYTWGTCTRTAATGLIPQFGMLNTIKAKMKTQIRQLLGKTNPTQDDDYDFFVEEGVEKLIPYKGSVKPIIIKVAKALQRSMWYQGVASIEELRDKAEVVLVSQGTFIENNPTI